MQFDDTKSPRRQVAPLQVSGGQPPSKLPKFGSDLPMTGLVSRPSWRRSTCCWRHRNPVIPPAKASARRVAAAAR
jgi:hypothetical protein